MKIDRTGNSVIVSNIKSEELFAFLKFQIPAKLNFVDSTKTLINEISLINRDYINGVKVIEIEIDGKSDIVNYDYLLKKISSFRNEIYNIQIEINVSLFKQKESLINLMQNISPSGAANCVYIDYYNNIFEIKNAPFKNGDSDKLYYFELNDTILGFSENGPVLITDNTNINSIEDVIRMF